MAPEGPGPVRKRSGFADAARTVLSGMIGVRRRADHERDTAHIRPGQIIVVALVFAALFIFALIAVVHLVVG